MKFEKIIEKINQRIKVDNPGRWNTKVKNLIIILGASRSGSSLLKEVLTKSSEIAYLSGEEEPWFLLTKNTFPFTNPKINKIKDKQRLLDYFHNDFGVNSDSIDLKHLSRRWRNRLLIQFPEIIEKELEKIPALVGKIFGGKGYTKNSIMQFLREFNSVNVAFYDLFKKARISYNRKIVIEQPPYVIPSFTRPVNEKDYKNKFFLFKCPQSSYRINVWQKLFPNARINYIYLTRGFAQSVNGLIDGWLYKTGFHAYEVSQKNKLLNIKGYQNKKWWKFDLPPNWEKFTNRKLEEVCLNQWCEANKSILSSNQKILTLKFEDFLMNPNKELEKITDYIGIPKITMKDLPHVMTTETPVKYRWVKRKNILSKLAKNTKIKELMAKLNYNMNQKEWI